jgi:outer membrane protein OmpA-like peptidoglycan-associated protein
MRTACAAALGLALMFGGSAIAGPSDQVSTQDYLDAIHEACPKTYVQQPNGATEPLVSCARGFSLATQGPAPNAGEKAAAPAPGGRRTARREVASATPARSSRLSNLLIYFKLGSAELTPDGLNNAANFAAALRDPSVAQLRFEIAGHTDITGRAARNASLSEARAEAVKAYLVSQGVDAARLTTKGYGSSELAVPSLPRSAANRRVEARPL